MKIEVYSPTIRRKEMDAVLTAMVEDRIGPGEQAARLIQTAREYLRFDYALALRSPAIALNIALSALNLKDGDGVLISALSPRYYGRVLEELRLRPVFCDVAPGTACISAETIKNAMDRGNGAAALACIVVHHTLGFIPDMEPVVGLGIPVIEDFSRSCGSSISEEPAPVSGILAILGLEERDMLTAGGGALLYAMNRRDSACLRALPEIPPEYCLPDINAALAITQFKESGRNLEKRREIGRLYTQSAMQGRHKRFIQTEEIEYNNYSFPLILETGMKDVAAFAKRKDVLVKNAFDDTLAGTIPGELCPEAYSLSLRTAMFPLYPRLGSSQITKVAKLLAALP